MGCLVGCFDGWYVGASTVVHLVDRLVANLVDKKAALMAFPSAV